MMDFVKKISDYITKKVADKLSGMCKTDRENYEKYWDDISPFIKFGCIKDEKFCERMMEYVLFKDLDGKYTTMNEYLEAQKPADEEAEADKAEEKTEEKADEKADSEEKEALKTTIYYVTDVVQQSQYINMFREQKMKMQVGRKYVVHAHVDEESYRIVASAKVERYLSKEKPEYTPGAEVNILIWQKTDLGFKAIIDDMYSGLLYENEIFCPLETGMEMKAFVKQVREDGKVDLILQKPGFEKIDDFSKTLLDYIKEHGGRINLNDKSPAEDIYATFGVSKKTFKKGVGDLYKKHLITLHEDGITLADS